MISVPADLVKVNMGNKRKWQGPNTSSTQSSTGQPIGMIVLGVVAALVGILGFMSVPITSIWDDHVTEFREVKAEAHNTGRTLERIQARLDMLEKLSSGVYRSQAKDAGFDEKVLQVIPVKLDSNVPYDAPLPTTRPDVFVRISQLQFSPQTQTLTYTLDANLPNKITISGIEFERQKVRVGETLNILEPFGVRNPQVFLRLLAVPVPDQAIIAMGSKREETDK